MNGLHSDAIFIDESDSLMHLGTPHQGSIPHSGRYAYGSGEDPFQHVSWTDYQADPRKFRANIAAMKKAGFTDKQIADKHGATIAQMRAYVSIAKDAQHAQDEAMARELMVTCNGNQSEVGRRMGINESQVRNLLKNSDKRNFDKNKLIVDALRHDVDTKGCVDVGKGSELYLGCTNTRLKTAIEHLKTEGYQQWYVEVPQLGTNHNTNVTMLADPKQIKFSDVTQDLTKIKPITSFASNDDGVHPQTLQYPAYISSDRLIVRFADDKVSGKLKDGVAEIRPGVPDLNLGNVNYAQVRIGVDDKAYIKGMAVYGDPKDFPEGVDIIFNSNKPSSKGKMGALKPYKLDGGNNPFGASIKEGISEEYTDADNNVRMTAGGQSYYTDPKTGERKLSAINKVNEEGDWNGWGRTLASQFLSKQKLPLIKQQLGIALQERKDELEEILAIPDNTVRKKFLDDFAENCDKASSQLRGARMPGQASKVILPIPSLKEDECFCPAYENGTVLSLIRYPHQGTFEIPTVVVNNNGKEGKRVIGNSIDGIGINPKTAARLSGADFDGDTVVCLPNRHGEITSTPYLDDLRDFDPDISYPKYEGMKVISNQQKQMKMGVITNLITDMTALAGANVDSKDMVDAVKFSLVIIDAEKHEYDWKRAWKECRVDELMKKYRGIDPVTGKVRKGAATIWSRAGAEDRVPERKKYPTIDKETGKKIYDRAQVKLKDPDGNPVLDDEGRQIYVDKTIDKFEWRVKDPVTGKETTKITITDPSTGKPKVVKANKYIAPEGYWVQTAKDAIPTEKVNRMVNADDAYELVSDPATAGAKERTYADFANNLKALANDARKYSINTKESTVDPQAKVIYKEEVESIKAKLQDSRMNAPRERQAQILANQIVNAQKKANPSITTDKDKMKKLKTNALKEARASVGSGKKNREIHLTAKEWEAVDNHAVNSTTLKALMMNMDSDTLRKHMVPTAPENSVPKSVQLQIKSMSSRGYTLAEISQFLDISKTTISKYAK